MIELTISIVNHNNRALLERCLESIYENTKGISFEIIVVDNLSADGSIDMLRAKFPEVKVIQNRYRKGFSENHNQALKIMRGQCVVLLNDDTEVLPGTFDKMVNYLQGHRDIGVLGCRILNPDGSLQQSVFRMPSLTVLFFHAFFLSYMFPNNRYIGGYKRWPHDKTCDVPFVIGACMMFPAEVIRKVDLMDERFYIYAEDSDVCLRVRSIGKRVVFYHEASIIHHGGSSMKQIGNLALENMYRSMNVFFEIHYGRWIVPAVAFLNVTGIYLRIIIWSILKLLKPAKKGYYNKKIAHFERVLDWYRKSKF